MPRASSGEHLLGGDLLVHHKPCGPGPGQGAPVFGEDEGLVGLDGLGQVGVGIDQGLAGAVLGEKRQHRAGALGTAGHVVLVQCHFFAPVHDGVKVQVEVAAGVGEQVGAQQRLAQRGEQPRLVDVLAPVGVGGQRGGLGQRGQPGEQSGADVGGQVIDVGDPPDPIQLQGQQRQQVAGGEQ